jgi:hypothetical protein
MLKKLRKSAFFILHFSCLPMDPDSESGSTQVIEFGYNPDPDPQPWFFFYLLTGETTGLVCGKIGSVTKTTAQ